VLLNLLENTEMPEIFYTEQVVWQYFSSSSANSKNGENCSWKN